MLSVCIISKNEEKYIAKCIESVIHLAKEVIVLDTGSTDNTVSIAKKSGAKVEIWKPNADFSFSEARNICKQYAKEEWILVLDCDETIIHPEAITYSIQNASNNTGGFYLIRRNNFYREDHLKDVDHRLNLRLFRNKHAYKWKGKIHERIVDSIQYVGDSLALCKAIIDHDLLGEGQSKIKDKQKKYLNTIENQLQVEMDDAWLWMQHGKTQLFLHNYLAAEPSLLNSIKLNNDYATVLSRLYLSLLYSYTKNFNNIPEQLNWVENNLPCSFLFFIKGEIALQNRNGEEAREHFLNCSLINQSSKYNLIPADKFLSKEELSLKLAECELLIGNLEKVENYLNVSLSNKTTSCLANLKLCQLKMRQGHIKKAIEYLDETIDDAPLWEQGQNLKNILIHQL